MAFTKSTSASPMQEANWLLSKSQWDLNGTGRGLPAGVITFSFPNDSSDYGKGNTNGFEKFLPEQIGAFELIFHSLEAFTNANFVEVTSTGQLIDLDGASSFTASDGSAMLRYAKTSKIGPDASYTYLPSEKADGGDAWFGNSIGTFNGVIEVGTFAYTVLLHEIGHSLGLEHTFDKGPYGVVPSAMDSLAFTVMSYNSFPGARDWYNEAHDFPQTYMMLDLASLQQMYGADFTTNYGNTRYTWDFDGGMHVNGSAQAVLDAPGTDTIFMTLWDGGGIDTIDARDFGSGVHIDLNPGKWITLSADQLADLDRNTSGTQAPPGNIANSLLISGTGPDGKATNNLIENAVGGAGADTIIGNDAANRLEGGGNSDTLSGGSAADFYVYRSLANSTGLAPDDIVDFDSLDIIVFVRFDANPQRSNIQPFTWEEGITAYSDLQPGEFGFVPSLSAGGILFARLDADETVDFQVNVTFSGPVDFTSGHVLQDTMFFV